MLLGIVEGFYGPLWDKLDRLSMIEFMYRIGMNVYIYAPKWDPYHRDRWRSPYPGNYLDMFAELIDEGRRKGVELVYAISPGLDLVYSSREDLNLLIRKLEGLMEHGFESIAVLLDDIPPELRGTGFRTLAEAQTTVVNKVYDELSPRHMFFCPIYYWGYKEDYLRELGELLDPRIMVMWTGPVIAPVRITRSDVEKLIEILGRKPVIWENYPVNDYFVLRGITRLHLGPIKSREPGIWDLLEGYMANPAIEAEASKIPLYTIAEFYKRREKYDPEKALIDAIHLVFPEEYWEPVEYFVKLNKATPFDPMGDHIPSSIEADKLLKTITELERLPNKKFLQETARVRGKLKAIAVKLKGGKVHLNPRIQTAGEYNPVMTDEESLFFFGEIVRSNYTWK